MDINAEIARLKSYGNTLSETELEENNLSRIDATFAWLEDNYLNEIDARSKHQSFVSGTLNRKRENLAKIAEIINTISGTDDLEVSYYSLLILQDYSSKELLRWYKNKKKLEKHEKRGDVDILRRLVYGLAIAVEWCNKNSSEFKSREIKTYEDFAYELESAIDDEMNNNNIRLRNIEKTEGQENDSDASSKIDRILSIIEKIWNYLKTGAKTIGRILSENARDLIGELTGVVDLFFGTKESVAEIIKAKKEYHITKKFSINLQQVNSSYNDELNEISEYLTGSKNYFSDISNNKIGKLTRRFFATIILHVIRIFRAIMKVAGFVLGLLSCGVITAISKVIETATAIIEWLYKGITVIKGIWKWAKGTKGVNREKYAYKLLNIATTPSSPLITRQFLAEILACRLPHLDNDRHLKVFNKNREGNGLDAFFKIRYGTVVYQQIVEILKDVFKSKPSIGIPDLPDAAQNFLLGNIGIPDNLQDWTKFNYEIYGDISDDLVEDYNSTKHYITQRY